MSNASIVNNCIIDLMIICVLYVLCLSCLRVCSLLPCGHLKGRADLLALVCDIYCDVVTFPFGILGQVWYLIVAILILAAFLTLLLTRQRSAVVNVSGYRCVSDCRSRGGEFDPSPVPYFHGD